jgi:CxxC motif-containing protein (DUF1111 family)
MFGFRFAAQVLLAALAIGSSATPSLGGDPAAGRVLFERVWTASDGLGPFFNERSCVACHALGGVGGAGPNSKNVEILSVDVPWWIKAGRSNRISLDTKQSADAHQAYRRLEQSVSKLHVDLRQGSMALHTFGTDPRYREFREALLGLKPTSVSEQGDSADAAVRHVPGVQPTKRVVHGQVQLLLSGRNSPAMFGAGLIDRVTDDEIQAVASEQRAEHPHMAGRMLGRFGWRGQTSKLQLFVAGACTVELGLDVTVSGAPIPAAAASPPSSGNGGENSVTYPPGFKATATPATGSGAGNSSATPPTTELNASQFDDLYSFVATIPAPVRRAAVDDAEAKLIEKGEHAFTSIGCAVCHRPSIGVAKGIYSDLLVHNLGAGLTDSQPAPLVPFGAQYYSESRSLGDLIDENRLLEWRTPPLWGLADSAPYLHDGRAATVEQAIAAHGGQAAATASAFAALPVDDRKAMLLFLSTLVAPDAPELKRTLAGNQLAGTFPNDGDDAEAKNLTERTASARLRLAMAARQRGEHESARRWLATLVKDFPGTTAAREALELLAPKANSTDDLILTTQPK